MPLRNKRRSISLPSSPTPLSSYPSIPMPAPLILPIDSPGLSMLYFLLAGSAAILLSFLLPSSDDPDDVLSHLDDLMHTDRDILSYLDDPSATTDTDSDPT